MNKPTLIACAECGASLSREAEACADCGYPCTCEAHGAPAKTTRVPACGRRRLLHGAGLAALLIGIVCAVADARLAEAALSIGWAAKLSGPFGAWWN